MVAIPAIDLFGGKCVRLTKGDYQKPTVYSDEPLEVVDEFLQARAEHIHVVDLDAARGTGDNKALIDSIVGSHDLKGQVAGRKCKPAAYDFRIGACGHHLRTDGPARLDRRRLATSAP